MSVEQTALAWYTADSSTEQRAAVDQLVGYASGRLEVAEWRDRSRATSTIIELVHLTRHRSDRVALIEQLGRCGNQFVAVPALHAETHSPHPDVRAAALTGLGRLGLPFGGALVARWLVDRDLDDEPGGVLEAALLALARTGHPTVGEQAERLWLTGRIGAAHLHTALADAVSPALLDLARAHIADPSVAVEAALHLDAVRVDDLVSALQPMRYGDNVAHVHIAERLLSQPTPGPEDHLLEVLECRWPIGAMGRAARRLRVHPPEQLASAFRALADGIDASGRDAKHWVKVALMAGIPELQAVALDLAESGSERTLVQAMHHVCHQSPGLAASLDRWEGHADPTVVAASIRARVNVFGPAALAHLERFARCDKPAHRLEYIRAIQNALRDRRGADGRSRLPHDQRTEMEARVRDALRLPDVNVQERAAFASGNIGLTGLADELRKLLTSSPEFRVRRAAATALSELPPSDQVAFIAECLARETEPEVRFRLVRVLLRALESGRASVPAVVEAARAGMADDDPQVAVLSMVLLGASGDLDAAGPLATLAAGPVQARAAAAITALGALGPGPARGALIALTSHVDPARRRRAAEALATVGGTDTALALLKLVERDADPEVRRAAVASLARCPVPATELYRLQPSGPDDPLIFELLQARLAAAGGAPALTAEEIDAQLTVAIPGFRATRLDRRNPAALRALRTAQYLGTDGDLPLGLDAAPPVLFWTKGLELWLNDALAPLLLHLRDARRLAALDAAVPSWNGMVRSLPEPWEDPPGQNLWKFLLGNLVNSLSGRNDKVLSLREIAAALIVGGPLAEPLGVQRWQGPLVDGQRLALANRLAKLASWRNPLTHRRAGTAEDARKGRELALEAASLAVSLG
jgi:HEAT repeat protein